MSMISVKEARARVLANVPSPDIEMTPLARSLGRTLARDITATRTQPPCAVSAMDGYAVRSVDLTRLPVRLKQIGVSAAGHGFAGAVGPMETVRIFTGAPAPEGADAVLIQEDAKAADGFVEPLRGVPAGKHLRAAGLDFSAGETLLRAGTRLTPAAIGLAAAMNHAELPVARRPKVGILASGDELALPGAPIGPGQIVSSNAYVVGALVEWAGGEAVDFGLFGDDLAVLESAVRAAIEAGCDVLTTSGGASVGDHDLMRPALAKAGMQLDFWRISLRPGAPLLHGGIGRMSVLGLPGNPVSAMVGAVLFLTPLLRALSGDPAAGEEPGEPALLGAPLPANDRREDYMRAALAPGPSGALVATPFAAQDSSLLSVLAKAQCLLIRPAHAPAAEAGEPCRIIRLPVY